MKRERVVADPMDALRFPPDPWRLVEAIPAERGDGHAETIFSVANGYLGMRGTSEEGRDAHLVGTFINGLHETWEIKHAENAYGFARVGQTMVNAPSATLIKLYVDDEPFSLPVADLVDYERSLDFRDGVLRRDLVWRTPAGKRVRVSSRRMVSFTDRHLAVMTFEVTLLNSSAPVVLSSQIVNRQDFDEIAGRSSDDDPRRTKGFDHRVLIPEMDWCSPRRMIMGYRTANSHMTVAVGADHTLDTANAFEQIDDTTPDQARKIYRIQAAEGVPITLTKVVAYHTSTQVPVRELSDRVRRTLDRVRETGAELCFSAQRAWLADYWQRSDVEVGATVREQQAVRWCIFQLAQASARADGMGVPAKGLTGDGYEGHYFWDSEVYLVPFLTLTHPTLARNALRYRYTHLDLARARAREMAVAGALFPWRTINGQEASAYYAAGTAQYHIDADVAYAVGHYGAMTGDVEFLTREGAEILVETARMWADLGFWRRNGEQVFEIHGVTGPDEYTTVVNNNTYTNVMARWNLRLAAGWVRRMAEHHPDALIRLQHRVGLDLAEIDEWERCAEGMKIPFDDALGIHPQDDDFLSKELWDMAGTPPERFPLLLNYHPLVIYRFQVLKQADVVLAQFLRPGEFSAASKLANFEYYDPITTGDSTLSAVIQAVVAAEVGHQMMAMDYFREGLFVDLADLHANSRDGVHVASSAGIWRCLVSGFGGLRDDGELTFDPRLPREWTHLSFPLSFRQSRIRVHLSASCIRFELEEGSPVPVEVRGQPVMVDTTAVEVPLSDQGPHRVIPLGSTPLVGGHELARGMIAQRGVDEPDRD